ncbi:MAG TPA: ABC transporter substrate-binding protein, partial [bacterium]|nr:ABC transporter substrate-binding protein [bacterium]
MRIRIVLAIVVISTLLGPQMSSRAATAADTLVYVNDISDMISLDPAVAYEFSGILAATNIYDTLVAFEGEDLTTLKPRLATSWFIRDSGSRWSVTLKLRPGVKFSTGRP